MTRSGNISDWLELTGLTGHLNKTSMVRKSQEFLPEKLLSCTAFLDGAGLW